MSGDLWQTFTTRRLHPSINLAEVAMLRALVENLLESMAVMARDIDEDPAINDLARQGAHVMLEYYTEYITNAVTTAGLTLERVHSLFNAGESNL